jgi:hypothetical protein
VDGKRRVRDKPFSRRRGTVLCGCCANHNHTHCADHTYHTYNTDHSHVVIDDKCYHHSRCRRNDNVGNNEHGCRIDHRL